MGDSHSLVISGCSTVPAGPPLREFSSLLCYHTTAASENWLEDFDPESVSQPSTSPDLHRKAANFVCSLIFLTLLGTIGEPLVFEQDVWATRGDVDTCKHELLPRRWKEPQNNATRKAVKHDSHLGETWANEADNHCCAVVNTSHQHIWRPSGVKTTPYLLRDRSKITQATSCATLGCVS